MCRMALPPGSCVIVKVIDSDADGCVLNPWVLIAMPPGAAGCVEILSVLTSVKA